MAGSAREEAERLVASVLARAVTGQAFGRQWATGEPECCVCPVCRAIAAMRDPKPETAAKLAGGAGDLAGSVAGLLRSVSAIVGESPRPAPVKTAPAPHADQAWSTATRAARPEPWAAATTDPEPVPSQDSWAAATTASAATTDADYAAELAERKAAARQAAAEAERRVAEAAAQAKARREKAAADKAAMDQSGETGDTAGGAARNTRTPQRFDVWAAAVASGATVDHDVAGAGAPAEREGSASDDGKGDEARDDGAA